MYISCAAVHGNRVVMLDVRMYTRKEFMNEKYCSCGTGHNIVVYSCFVWLALAMKPLAS